MPNNPNISIPLAQPFERANYYKLKDTNIKSIRLLMDHGLPPITTYRDDSTMSVVGELECINYMNSLTYLFQ